MYFYDLNLLLLKPKILFDYVLEKWWECGGTGVRVRGEKGEGMMGGRG